MDRWLTVVSRRPYLLAGTLVALNLVIVLYRQSFHAIGGAWSVVWIGMLLVGLLITARVPGNAIGPICLAYGLLTQLSLLIPPVGLHQAPDARSSTWTEPVGWAVNTGVIALLPVMLVRFPDGRLLGRRWRFVDLAALIFGLVGAAAAFINNGWGGDVSQAGIDGPLRRQYGSVGDTLSMLFLLGLPLLSLAALVSLIIRYRRADARQRRQLRWLIYAVVVGGAGVALSDIFLTATPSATDWAAWVTAAFIAMWPAAIGIAIVREGLYDIDVLISRTLIYGSILATIAGIYVAIVFGIGSFIGRNVGRSPLLPILATAVIAMAFQPLRVRLERLANRVVFGRRSTPYEVLSAFTQRVAATDDHLLSTVAQSVVDGTVGMTATVWTLDDGVLEPVSVWPSTVSRPPTPALYRDDGRELLVPGADETFAIRYHGDVIGALGLSVPTGESLPPGDRAMINELTAGLGLALWNRTMTANLEASIDELRASRRRLVAVQDETRHRLERDLHDGAQQRLVAVKVRLSILQQMAAKADAPRTAQKLAAACADADEAIESLRDFARGVYPPLLEAEGLGVALKAQVARLPYPITLTSTIERRHSRDTEATVYFCLLETLAILDQVQQPSQARVAVSENDGCLTFELNATHRSGSPAFEPPGHLLDRVEALDGSLRLSAGSTVTEVQASFPVDDESLAGGRLADDGRGGDGPAQRAALVKR